MGGGSGDADLDALRKKNAELEEELSQAMQVLERGMNELREEKAKMGGDKQRIMQLEREIRLLQEELHSLRLGGSSVDAERRAKLEWKAEAERTAELFDEKKKAFDLTLRNPSPPRSRNERRGAGQYASPRGKSPPKHRTLNLGTVTADGPAKVHSEGFSVHGNMQGGVQGHAQGHALTADGERLAGDAVPSGGFFAQPALRDDA